MTPEMKEEARLNREPVSSETRAKISAAKKGQKHTEEAKRKISEALKGRPGPTKGRPLSKEHKEKCRIASTGRKYSEEIKTKRAEAVRKSWIKRKARGDVPFASKKPITEEQRKNASEGQKRRWANKTPEEKEAHRQLAIERSTSEVRAKISAARKGKNLSDEHKAKISAAIKGKPCPQRSNFPHDEAYREKQRIAHTGKKHTEETKAKMREGWARRKAREAAESNKRPQSENNL